MKRKYFRFCLVFNSLLICLYQKTNAQGIQPIAHLEPGTIKIGEQAKLDLLIHQPRAALVDFPKIADSIISKVQVINVGKTDTTADPADKVNVTVHKRYIITSFDAGTYAIPAFNFNTRTGIIKSNELTMVVQTVKVDTTKSIYDIKQPLAVSYTLWDWLRDHWIWVVSVLAAILIAIAITWYITTIPKKVADTKELIPDLPIHVVALNQLQQLLDKKLWQQGEVKAYYIELSDIIRDYLEKRYLIKTQEKTSDEIFFSIKHLDISPENTNLLRQILILSDLVKFAKEQPAPQENDKSMDNSISFVTKTRQVVEASKPADEGGNNEPA